VGVQKHDDGGKVIIVIDEELEIRQSLATFILRRMVRGRGIIDRVDEIAPSGR